MKKESNVQDSNDHNYNTLGDTVLTVGDALKIGSDSGVTLPSNSDIRVTGSGSLCASGQSTETQKHEQIHMDNSEFCKVEDSLWVPQVENSNDRPENHKLDENFMSTNNQSVTKNQGSDEIFELTENEKFVNQEIACDSEPRCAVSLVSNLRTEYQVLQKVISENIGPPFHLIIMEDVIQIVEYYTERNTSVKLSVHIEEDFSCRIFVHRVELPSDHEIWKGLPKMFKCFDDIQRLLDKLEHFSVCMGIPEPELQDLMQPNDGQGTNNGIYRERNCCVVKGDTIRSLNCRMFVLDTRCEKCKRYYKTLYERKQWEDKRRKELKQCEDEKIKELKLEDLISDHLYNEPYSRSYLIEKIKELKLENLKLRRQVHGKVSKQDGAEDQSNDQLMRRFTSSRSKFVVFPL